MNDTETDNC